MPKRPLGTYPHVNAVEIGVEFDLAGETFTCTICYPGEAGATLAPQKSSPEKTERLFTAPQREEGLKDALSTMGKPMTRA